MERLHRLEQLYVENPVYFLTFRTDGQKAILADETIHRAFIDFCHEALTRSIFVGRYILMPDHVHLFVKLPPPSENLSMWVKSLKNYLSKSLRSRKVPAPHWQKGFFDHVLRSTESYSKKWLYMVENSIRAGLVTDWAQWPYQGEIQPLRLDENWRRSQTAAT
jgi:REP element-mobilizing transposase RayT